MASFIVPFYMAQWTPLVSSWVSLTLLNSIVHNPHAHCAKSLKAIMLWNILVKKNLKKYNKIIYIYIHVMPKI